MNSTQSNPQLEVATNVALESGALLLKLLGHADVRHKDSSRNLVTQADLESEAIITNPLLNEFPDHQFLCEEGVSTGTAESDHLWIIDPLDATNNYAHGIPHFCVSIAYAEKGEVKVGVVFDPIRKEIFTAARGEGAWLNEVPIHVSGSDSLDECIIGTGFFYDRGTLMKRTLTAIEHLFEANIRGIRRMGSAALDLCWVGCGRYDAFFEYQLAPWDYAAGQLIIEEAGGRCADRVDAPLEINSGNVIASNGVIHEKLVDIIRWEEMED